MNIIEWYRLQVEIFYEEAKKHWNNPDIRDYYLTLSNEAEREYERRMLCQM